MPVQLSENFLKFIAKLRGEGFVIGPREAADALRFVADHEPETARLRAGLKVLLSMNRDQWDRFDGLFDTHWLTPAEMRPLSDWEAGASIISMLSPSVAGQTRLDEGGNPHQPTQMESQTPGALDSSSSASAEALTRIDLADLADPRELAEAERIALKLAQAMRRRITRRLRAARRGPRLDLRRIIRASLARGGEPTDLHFKKRPLRRVRLVVLLDVSGSMNAFTRIFVQFARGLASQRIDAEVHLMHTRLVDATAALSERDAAHALARLTEMSTGFGGGTRLGSCLADFNRARRRGGRLKRAAVVVFSDGYDSGPEETFAREFELLAHRAKRLIWLNPLSGRAGYRPVTLAMHAALPHIDHFAPANTLASLAALESELARL